MTVPPPDRRPGLVISDVDGTLVTTKKQLTDRAIAAVRRLREAGIRFAVTSSRPPRGLRMLIEPLALDTPIGGFNGGLFMTPALQPIEANLLPAATAREAVRYLEENGVDVWVFSGNDWLVTDPEGAYVGLERFTVDFEPTVVDSFEPHLDSVAKLVGSTKDFDRLARCESELKTRLAPATVARSQTYYLDITDQHANKGTVVRTLARQLGIEPSGIMALGDMGNDLPMFAEAGFSVAMGQATDEVKAAADAVTDTNENDGFAKAIDRYVFGEPG